MLNAPAMADDDERWRRLAELYRHEQPGLVRLAVLLFGSQPVAEELVHDAFVNLHPRLHEVREPGAYLRTSVVNLTRGHLRRRATAAAHPVEPPPAVDDLAIPHDRTEVWLALRALPHRQRCALVLRYYLDLADEDVAELLGARPATVRSLVHRGLGRLREVLRP